MMATTYLTGTGESPTNYIYFTVLGLIFALHVRKFCKFYVCINVDREEKILTHLCSLLLWENNDDWLFEVIMILPESVLV